MGDAAAMNTAFSTSTDAGHAQRALPVPVSVLTRWAALAAARGVARAIPTQP
ncbi:MAG TPA: hypothetical protein VN257_08730 [Actinotalea sp.]|nr:hypothetical protein [Actinotalea sp.]